MVWHWQQQGYETIMDFLKSHFVILIEHEDTDVKK